MMMALKFFSYLVLFTIVSCQTENTPGQFETQTNAPDDTQTSQNITDQINVFVNDTNSFPVTETTTGTNVGIDEGDGGKADDLFDYFKKKFGEPISGDVKNNYEDVNSTPSEEDLQNCSLPAVLDRYCEGVPGDVHAYFKYDMSVPGVLASIFKPEVVGALQLSCAPGNWCLPDSFHQDVIQRKNLFYLESPFCSDAMWSCVKNMQDKRINCGEEQLNYLVNTIVLLCDLEGLGYLGTECYARTVEALYVTLADMTNPSGSRKSTLEQEDCNDYKVQMTKTYLCADDVCNFDQNLLLERFETWVGVAQKAADVAFTCNISRTCQTDYEPDDADDKNTFPYGYYDDYAGYGNYKDDEYEGNGGVSEDTTIGLTDEIIEEENEQEEGEKVQESGGSASDQTGNDDEVNANSNNGYDEQDRSMMLGLIVMTTVLLLGFVGLAFVVYKRFRRARNGNYKWGYSQLTNEDMKKVQNEYK